MRLTCRRLSSTCAPQLSSITRKRLSEMSISIQTHSPPRKRTKLSSACENNLSRCQSWRLKTSLSSPQSARTTPFRPSLTSGSVTYSCHSRTNLRSKLSARWRRSRKNNGRCSTRTTSGTPTPNATTSTPRRKSKGTRGIRPYSSSISLKRERSRVWKWASMRR